MRSRGESLNKGQILLCGQWAHLFKRNTQQIWRLRHVETWQQQENDVRVYYGCKHLSVNGGRRRAKPKSELEDM